MTDQNFRHLVPTVSPTIVGVLLLLASCGTMSEPLSQEPGPAAQRASAQPTTTQAATTELAVAPESSTTASATTAEVSEQVASATATSAPKWLGSRVLATGPDGRVEPQTTPAELVDRRLITTDTLPPPLADSFVGEIEPVSEDVAARSTWNPQCPVPLEELRYLQLSFWGFDGLHHQGEMIVHAEVATEIVEVFAKLHEARFPIEEMRVVTNADVAADPTGDGNNTSSFVCRNVTNGSSFSQHGYGLAIDINPFQNPYQRGDLVLPELSTAYLDRTRNATGMVSHGDVVQSAFSEIGWSWGGNWNSLKDYQHFSANNK